MIDPAKAKKLIDSDSTRQTKLKNQKRYVEGKNTAILGRAAHEEPDNRIAIPICRKAVTIVSGYMAGDDAISYSTEDEYFEDTLKPIFDANDEQLTTHELFETACTHGEAWEYHFMLDGQPRFIEIPVEECIPIWDDSLPPKLVGMVRYYRKKDDNDKEYIEVFVYDDRAINHYTYKSGESMQFIDTEIHAYGEVPFARARINRYNSNLFDHVISIIDFRDRIVSEDWANELQRFAHSYLLLANRLSQDLDEQGQNEVDKIKISRTFEDLGENVKSKVDFLIKNIPADFIDKADKLFERLSYDMMLLFSNEDIATTGQISGISLAYKLLPFEYASKTYQAYFSRFLQWRIRLIQNVTGNMKANPQDRPQVTISFRRNLPFDMQSATDQFVKVAGILPNEIALKLFPASFIPDIDEVAKEMEDSKPSQSVGDETIPTNREDGAEDAE